MGQKLVPLFIYLFFKINPSKLASEIIKPKTLRRSKLQGLKPTTSTRQTQVGC